MTNSEKNENGKITAQSLFSDAILVGGITILGYASAYMYEIERAEILGVPSEMVTVSTEMCLVTTLILFTVFFTGAVLANTIAAIIPAKYHNEPLLQIFWPIAVAIVMVAIVAKYVTIYAIAGEVVLIIGLIYWLAVPFWSKLKGSYWQKMRFKAQANLTMMKQNRRKQWIDLRLRVPVTSICGLIAFTLCISAITGRTNGRLGTTYYVTADDQNEVLLARYGETLVFRKPGSVEVNFKKLGDEKIPPLTKVRTGSMAIMVKSPI